MRGKTKSIHWYDQHRGCFPHDIEGEDYTPAMAGVTCPLCAAAVQAAIEALVPASLEPEPATPARGAFEIAGECPPLYGRDFALEQADPGPRKSMFTG